MTEKKKSVLTWGVLGAIVVAGVLAGRCAPSGPKGKKAPAAASDIASLSCTAGPCFRYDQSGKGTETPASHIGSSSPRGITPRLRFTSGNRSRSASATCFSARLTPMRASASSGLCSIAAAVAVSSAGRSGTPKRPRMSSTNA